MRRPLHRLQATYEPGFHLEMLLDRERLERYAAAIRACVRRGDVVVDMGTGTGVLAMMAAQAGAARVYTIELDPELAAETRERFRRSGFAERLIGPVVGDATVVDLPEPVDVILGEMLHSWLVEEQQAPAVQNLKRFLRPGGRILPVSIESFISLAEVAVQQPGAAVLGPFHLWPHEPRLAKVLTEEALAHVIDFMDLSSLEIEREVALRGVRGGQANVCKLDSCATFPDGGRLGKSMTIFPSIYIPLSEPVTVRSGGDVHVSFRFRLGCRWSEVELHARRV